MASPTLPKMMKALVQESKDSPFIVKEIPTPEPGPGSVVVKILYNMLQTQTRDILSGKSGFRQVRTWSNPFIPGGRAIARVAAPGPDTTSLATGQLVLLEPFIRARDKPDVWIMWGAMDGTSPAAKKLFAENWRHATWSEYALAPLENTWALDEDRLCGELGYKIPDLLQLAVDAVAYSGLKGIGLKAGEQIVVTPATGAFSGAGVGVAVAMGARVVAVGRKDTALRRLRDAHPGFVRTVVRTGDLATDTEKLQQFGTIDAFLEMAPFGAEGSNHVRAAFNVLKQYGRACVMGMGAGATQNVEISMMELTFKSITVHGHAMYRGEDVRDVIRMAEAGVLKLGKHRGFDEAMEFSLEDYENGFEWVAEHNELGQLAVLVL
ncbi:chaperonin 10-like protein [Phaeosphaeria sp. MPI-PUGE-AT-0046c]|nr:chaperonin 10-like protein [Phaeosphaeria sp. MPI-PUGE-AT-0046c]